MSRFRTVQLSTADTTPARLQLMSAPSDHSQAGHLSKNLGAGMHQKSTTVQMVHDNMESKLMLWYCA